VFIGQGLIPESYNQLADTIAEEELIYRLDEFRNEIRDKVEEMRRHDRFIDRHCAVEPPIVQLAEEARL
jgi:hypothetical protein